MSEHHKYQFVVICRQCGIRPLSYDDYMRQMRRPDSYWSCPSCGGDAQWDDDSLETNPAEPPCDGPPDEPLSAALSPAPEPTPHEDTATDGALPAPEGAGADSMMNKTADALREALRHIAACIHIDDAAYLRRIARAALTAEPEGVTAYVPLGPGDVIRCGDVYLCASGVVARTADTGEKYDPGIESHNPHLRPITVPGGESACSSCDEGQPLNECPKSQRPCGHHCNHAWSHDECCWCGKEFGDKQDQPPAARDERAAFEKWWNAPSVLGEQVSYSAKHAAWVGWQAAIASRAQPPTSIPWSALKFGEWFQYRLPEWSGPWQKHYQPGAAGMEFRRCEPPKWWVEYMLEKESPP